MFRERVIMGGLWLESERMEAGSRNFEMQPGGKAYVERERSFQ